MQSPLSGLYQKLFQIDVLIFVSSGFLIGLTCGHYENLKYRTYNPQFVHLCQIYLKSDIAEKIENLYAFHRLSAYIFKQFIFI